MSYDQPASQAAVRLCRAAPATCSMFLWSINSLMVWLSCQRGFEFGTLVFVYVIMAFILTLFVHVHTTTTQGMEYLHAKGISHPLLTSRAVTVHYRVCISMLKPCGASQGLLDADDIIYCPSETVRTVRQESPSRHVSSHHRGGSGSSVGLKADPLYMHTDSANVFSFG